MAGLASFTRADNHDKKDVAESNRGELFAFLVYFLNFFDSIVMWNKWWSIIFRVLNQELSLEARFARLRIGDDIAKESSRSKQCVLSEVKTSRMLSFYGHIWSHHFLEEAVYGCRDMLFGSGRSRFPELSSRSRVFK